MNNSISLLALCVLVLLSHAHTLLYYSKAQGARVTAREGDWEINRDDGTEKERDRERKRLRVLAWVFVYTYIYICIYVYIYIYIHVYIYI